MKRYHLRHETRYTYVDPISLAHNIAHVQLRTTPWQRVVAETITLQPQPLDLSKRVDYFGNHTLYFSVQEPHVDFSLVVESEVALDLAKRPTGKPRITREELADWLRDHEDAGARQARRYLWSSPRISPQAEIAAWAAKAVDGEPSVFGMCTRLMDVIHSTFEYDTAATDAGTSLAQSFAARAGVCQDFAHVMIAALRVLDIPARYVSGYLETEPAPGQDTLIGADATHAWVSAYFPETGWIDFDPTNNSLPFDQHITLAWGRDVSDVVPVKGVIVGGEQQKIAVSVDVTRPQ